MKTSIAIVLIIVGGMLVLAPVAGMQWQVQRTAAFYEQHGTGSALPQELQPQPYSSYEWATLGIGLIIALMGVIGSIRFQVSSSRL